MLYEVKNYEPVYPIRTAAKLLNISVHTLRMYEKEGLILPFKKSTHHRLYSKSDIDKINCIRAAINESKISINGIKAIYSMMPCWEVIHCPIENRNKCNGFLNHSEPCWAAKGNESACTSNECRNCTVYKDYGDCGSIKNFIRTKLSSL